MLLPTLGTSPSWRPNVGDGITRDLHQLVWIKAHNEEGRGCIEVSYAIDPRYIYHREVNACELTPRPRYLRASHKTVFSNPVGWGDVDPGSWEPVDETNTNQDPQGIGPQP